MERPPAGNRASKAVDLEGLPVVLEPWEPDALPVSDPDALPVDAALSLLLSPLSVGLGWSEDRGGAVLCGACEDLSLLLLSGHRVSVCRTC